MSELTEDERLEIIEEKLDEIYLILKRMVRTLEDMEDKDDPHVYDEY